MPRTNATPRGTVERPRGLLAGMRIRKKLIVLHSVFSLALAGVLILFLRPATSHVVGQAEFQQARLLLELALREGVGPQGIDLPRTAVLRMGEASELELSADLAERLRRSPGKVVRVDRDGDATVAGVYDAGSGRFATVSVRIPESRDAVIRLYVVVIVALVAVYLLIAAALEIFVLPAHVYGPIRRTLEADRALREGRRDRELIPPSEIPADELGEIMRSRNESVSALRRHERDLGEALAQLEQVAADLTRKNYLLENAKRNLADADRLASLGVMSAGIAHELNTPLSVLKVLVEKLARQPGSGASESDAALMLRVVGRLERLSESLLDFARARPSSARAASVYELVNEAITLVSLDRDARRVTLVNSVPRDFTIRCEPERIIQVLINLVRNAVDAIGSAPGRVEVTARYDTRDGQRWASIVITDDGPGINPEVLPRLFEPFASTRLDARGTGLGLAVSFGIVREHGGLLIARNRTDARGAEFEILLPDATPAPAGTPE